MPNEPEDLSPLDSRLQQCSSQARNVEEERGASSSHGMLHHYIGINNRLFIIVVFWILMRVKYCML